MYGIRIYAFYQDGPARLGFKGYILKADRGDRAGKFAVIWEYENVEQWSLWFPKPGEITQEALWRLGPEFAEINKKLNIYVMDWPGTDYIEQIVS